MIDFHAHLDGEKFASDRADAIVRAKAAGLRHVVQVGQWRKPGSGEPNGVGFEEAKAVAALDPAFLSFTAGIHPHEAANAGDADWAALEQFCRGEPIVAVGECGLDYHYDHSPRDQQRAAFERQARLARELDKPLVVHTREADDDTHAILSRELGPRGGAIHCFTGSWSAARRYLDLGLYLSIPGVVTFKAAEDLREAVRKLPLDRLLVETDCPYLAPAPHRGKRNEPAFVVLTAQKIAELRGVPAAVVGESSSENARRLLGLRIQP
jgi:TatD DNase family protein